jgi:prepilin-type N-terminal cleavage/methylation domain-containing protein
MKQAETSRRAKRAFTLVEMSVAMVASSIMFLAIVGVLASSHKEWNQTYERVHGQVVTDAYVVRKVFDRIVRQASVSWCDPLDSVGSSITLGLYPADGFLVEPPGNRYATFSLSDGNLILEEGDLDTSGLKPACRGHDSTQTLASHVTSCTFWRSGPCIHMSMVINDGKTELPVALTATRHNP